MDSQYPGGSLPPSLTPGSQNMSPSPGLSEHCMHKNKEKNYPYMYTKNKTPIKDDIWAGNNPVIISALAEDPFSPRTHIVVHNDL